MEIGTVRQVDVDQEMQGAYLDYAMSVIVSRALPDVRDGLKPVHRRILYAMHDMGLSSDKPYKKSARIVGEVLGKYHPHGDAAVYESMARMAQDFSLRYMLVDGQGNFGSIDGDSPAAMRYTEARLASMAEQMLLDIDKGTVDWAPNFDDTLTEPSVLPALVPNLLVNGTSGIAVGMTTNVPPHNLGEVVGALVYLIDHYSGLDEVTIEDLTEYVQGPDFPTGGVIYRYAEEGTGDRIDLIRNAYALGKGHITIQAHVYIEEMSRSRSRIVVTELPYQVNKTRLIERIAELVRDGKLEGVADLRDESDRQGMRICIELTRTVDPRETLSQLFRLTPMQTTFGLHMLALVDGEPRLLPLKRVLVLFLEHRQVVVTRRSRYLLEKAKARAHILEGLLRALDHIDEVVRIIRSSQTADTARKNLMDRLKLSELQADAILEMPLKRLVALERRKIADEHKEKLAEIKHLTELLKSPAKIRGAIRAELLDLKAKYGDARRTRIADREKGHHTARDLVQAQAVVLTLWQDGQVRMDSSTPAGLWKVAPVAQMQANTQDDAVVFTASGKAALVPLHQLPDGQSVPLSGLAALDASEKLVGMVALAATPSPSPGEAGGGTPVESYLTLSTRLGRIKRVVREELASAAARGAATVVSLEEGDELAWVEVTSGSDEVFLVTRQGQAIRFAEGEVRPMGLAAAGVMAIKLDPKDAVVGMGICRATAFVVTFTDAGYAKRTPVGLFPAQKRYGSGVQAAKCTSRTGAVAVAALAGEGQDLVLATAKGRAARIAVRTINPMARSVTGSRTPQDSAEPYFEPDRDGPPLWLVVLPGSGKVEGSKPEPRPSRARAPRRKAGREATSSPQSERPKSRKGEAKKAASTPDPGEASVSLAVLRSLKQPAAAPKKGPTSGRRKAEGPVKPLAGKKAPDARAAGGQAPAAKGKQGTPKKKATPPVPTKKPSAGSASQRGKSKSPRAKRERGEQMPLPLGPEVPKTGEKAKTRKPRAK
jgi:DNA gyrase subunit A